MSKQRNYPPILHNAKEGFDRRLQSLDIGPNDCWLLYAQGCPWPLRTVCCAAEDKQSKSEEAQPRPRSLEVIKPAYTKNYGVITLGKKLLSPHQMCSSDEVFSKVTSGYQSCE